MKLFIIIFTSLIYLSSSYGQNNGLVINNNAFVVMDGGVFIVVDQTHQNGIITTGTGGHIISEDETNKIRWEINQATGIYTIPFTTTPSVQGGNEVKIPYTLEIQTAGVGANSHIDFSTYETATDMNTTWPSMVTQMNDADVLNFDNSLNVMDRYWLIDANSYSTKPDPNMTFGYDDSPNEIGGTNTITEANLVAQRFDDNTDTWGGDILNSVYFWGSSNVASNIVSGVDVTSNDFFTAWVLVNKLSILPIQLDEFDGECFSANSIKIKWSSLSETNNNYYTIEKSKDGINWTHLNTVNGAGNSSSIQNYSLIDENPSLINFYKLYQTDFDGKTKELKTIKTIACSSDNISVNSNINGGYSVSIESQKDDNFTVSIYDMRGRKVDNTYNFKVTQGINNISFDSQLSFGMYSIVIESETKKVLKKIIINK